MHHTTNNGAIDVTKGRKQIEKAGFGSKRVACRDEFTLHICTEQYREQLKVGNFSFHGIVYFTANVTVARKKRAASRFRSPVEADDR